LGDRKGIQPVKKTERWGASVVICLERGADLHMAQLMPLPLTVSCFSKIQIGFTFLIPDHQGSPGKGPLNGCVCVCVVKHDRICFSLFFDLPTPFWSKASFVLAATTFDTSALSLNSATKLNKTSDITQMPPNNIARGWHFGQMIQM